VSVIIDAAFKAWGECRAEFEDLQYAEHEKAAEACRDRLLNRRGMKAKVDTMTLFMGNEARAHAYASEELMEYWRSNTRPTFARFEAQWVEKRDSAA